MNPVVEVVGAAIVRDGRCLVARRGPKMSLAGRWEFPGGKVEAGELPRAALAREIAEELGILIAVGDELGTVVFEAAHAKVVLQVFWATIERGEPALREHDAIQWCARGDLARLDWAEADIPLMQKLALELPA